MNNDSLEFELKDVYRQPLVLGISGLPEGWAVQSVRYGGRDITDIPVDLGLGSPRDLVEIRLTSRVAQPAVRVTSDEGAPVTAYHAVVLPADSATRPETPWLVTGTPSRDGVLKLDPRAPGDYRLAAVSPDDYVVLLQDPARLDDLAPVAIPVSLTVADERTFDLRITRLPAKR